MYSHMAPVIHTCTCHVAWFNSLYKVCTLQYLPCTASVGTFTAGISSCHQCLHAVTGLCLILFMAGGFTLPWHQVFQHMLGAVAEVLHASVPAQQFTDWTVTCVLGSSMCAMCWFAACNGCMIRWSCSAVHVCCLHWGCAGLCCTVALHLGALV